MEAMNESVTSVIGVTVLVIALIAFIAQGILALLITARHMNNAGDFLRAALLAIGIAVASLGIYTSKVFPCGFAFGLFNKMNCIDLPMYLASMFIGLLFSFELMLMNRDVMITSMGILGLMFVIINGVPVVAECM